MQTFWVIAECDIAAWWTDAEEVEALNQDHAVEEYADMWGDGHEPDEEEYYVVADNRKGIEAVKIKVHHEVVHEYQAVSEAEPVTIPDDPDDGPNEHFDNEDDDDEPESVKVKGTEDDATLPLFA